MFKCYDVLEWYDDGRIVNFVDHDFEIIVEINEINIMIVDVFIDLYSKKELNVAKNLFLFLKWEAFNDDATLNNLINYYKKYALKFEKYLPEINKYLVLA